MTTGCPPHRPGTLSTSGHRLQSITVLAREKNSSSSSGMSDKSIGALSSRRASSSVSCGGLFGSRRYSTMPSSVPAGWYRIEGARKVVPNVVRCESSLCERGHTRSVSAVRRPVLRVVEQQPFRYGVPRGAVLVGASRQHFKFSLSKIYCNGARVRSFICSPIPRRMRASAAPSFWCL